MKMRVVFRILAAAVLLLWTVFAFPLPAAAKEDILLEIRPQIDTAYEAQQVEMIVSLKNLPGAAACFDLQVESDPKRFTLKRVRALGEIASGELHYHTVDSTTYLVYYDKEGGESPLQKGGDLLSLVFTVNDGALSGQIPFSFQCSVIGDRTAGNMGMASARCTVRVTPPPSDNALLADMIPSAGRLVPGFSAECFSYSLEVGSNVDKLTFRCKTAHPSATVQVNRETLNGKGKSTRMIVTVTAADRSIRKYIITVLRKKGANIPQEISDPPTVSAQPKEVNWEENPKDRPPLHGRAVPLNWALGLAGLFLAVPIVFSLCRRSLKKRERMKL